MAFVPFTGVDLLLAEHAGSLPQPDQLGGPFVARLAVAALTGGPVPDCAAFARAAGTTLRPPEAAGPADAASRGRAPRDPASGPAPYGLAWAATPDAAGTAAAGLGRAVERLSGGDLAAVPATGTWTPDRLRVLLDGLTGIPVLPLANLLSSWFVSTHSPPEALAAFLETGDDTGLPGADRRRGHFVVLYGREDGPGGTLLAVADTDPRLGDGGTHRQPLARVAAALARRRRATGGLVLVTLAPHRRPVLAAVRAAGMRAEWWHNGTPDPPGERPGVTGV